MQAKKMGLKLFQFNSKCCELWRRLVACSFVIFVLGGCVNATLQEVRERETGFVAGQSVVVIGRSSLPSTAETELDFIGCVATDLSKKEKGLRVIPADEFRDVVFPWFEPRVEPEKSTQLAGLLDQPRLAAQLDSIGLRYLVWVDGRTSRTSSAGSLGCAVGPREAVALAS